MQQEEVEELVRARGFGKDHSEVKYLLEDAGRVLGEGGDGERG